MSEMKNHYDSQIRVGTQFKNLNSSLQTLKDVNLVADFNKIKKHAKNHPEPKSVLYSRNNNKKQS